MFVVVSQCRKHEILCVSVEVRLDKETGVGCPDVEIVRLGSQGLFEELVCLVAIVECCGKFS